MIGIKIIKESLFEVPLLKIQLKRTYVTGEMFNLKVKIVNLDKNPFLGGIFWIVIPWSASRLQVEWKFPISALAPNEVTIINYGNTHVLGPFPTLIYVKGKDRRGKIVKFCDMSGNRLDAQQKSKLTHIDTIFPKSAEELYQLWALIIAIVALSPLFVKEVIMPLLQWLMSA